jgi:hypothetical protein
MDEITLDDKTYVSSKRAAEITGYAKDYVGQLCREGRVEARLVGRNWYVLEDSIREHRFGAPAITVPESPKNLPQIPEMAPDPVVAVGAPIAEAMENAWKSPNYTTIESPMLIPTLNTEEKKPEINVIDKYAEHKGSYGIFKEEVTTPSTTSAIKEMQSAWHDWFVRTNELEVSEETLLEGTKINELSKTSEEKEETVPIHRMNSTESLAATLENTPEDLKSAPEASLESFGVEEQVPLHRAPEAPVERINTTSSVYSRSELRKEVFAPVKNEYEGRIIRERRVVRRKKPNSFLQTVFVLIAAFAVIITAIDSGKLDNFLSQAHLNFAPIQYLGGESTVIKTSK